MGVISTRYRTVTYETYAQSLNIAAMITELPLSSFANSFERTIDYAEYTDRKAELNISANGPSSR